MERVTTISRTDLARRTRQAVDRVLRGDTLIVHSYGEEQVVIMDVLDYRIMRAVAAYHHLPRHPSPATNPDIKPRGLSEEELAKYLDLAISSQGDIAANREIQPRWNRVIAAYLDGDIDLEQAAMLLDLSSPELDERFRRLDVPHPRNEDGEGSAD